MVPVITMSNRFGYCAQFHEHFWTSVLKKSKKGWKRSIYACYKLWLPAGKIPKNPMAIIMMTKMGTMSSVTFSVASM